MRGTIVDEESRALVDALNRCPAKWKRSCAPATTSASRWRASIPIARDFLFLGRGIHYPIALEGALKLKEISYIHAEGYPAGEMKHGPNALIDETLPVVVLATKDETNRGLRAALRKDAVEHPGSDGAVGQGDRRCDRGRRPHSASWWIT